MIPYGSECKAEISMWLAEDWTNFTHNEKQSNNSTNSCNNKAILLKVQPQEIYKL